MSGLEGLGRGRLSPLGRGSSKEKRGLQRGSKKLGKISQRAVGQIIKSVVEVQKVGKGLGTTDFGLFVLLPNRVFWVPGIFDPKPNGSQHFTPQGHWYLGSFSKSEGSLSHF